MALFYDDDAALPVLKGARELLARARKVKKSADEVQASADAITDALLSGRIVNLRLMRGDALPPTPTNPTPPTDARNVDPRRRAKRGRGGGGA
jgi:hypothetical protein